MTQPFVLFLFDLDELIPGLGVTSGVLADVGVGTAACCAVCSFVLCSSSVSVSLSPELDDSVSSPASPPPSSSPSPSSLSDMIPPTVLCSALSYPGLDSSLGSVFSRCCRVGRAAPFAPTVVSIRRPVPLGLGALAGT